MTARLSIEERIERIEAVLGLGSVSELPPVPWQLRRLVVLRGAARLFNISVADLVGPSRLRPLVIARAAVVLVLRAAPPMGYTEIGRLLQRDHSSIIGLERRGTFEMGNRPEFAPLVDELRNLFLVTAA